MAVQKTKPLKDYTFYINDSLKYRKYSKVTYFECKFEASLFAYALKENFITRIEFQNSIRRLSFCAVYRTSKLLG